MSVESHVIVYDGDKAALDGKGYIVKGDCLICGAIFDYNPHSVPSLSVHGKREPMCGDCAEFVMRARADAGSQWEQVREDAYDWCEAI